MKMSLRLLTPFVVLWALTLGACTQSNGRSSVDAGTLALVGRSCDVDAECGALRCDKLRRHCICLSDESCRSADPEAPPKYCNNFTGMCVEAVSGCTKSEDCESGEYCDSATRTCRALKAFCMSCQNDAECGGADDNCLTDTTLNEKFCSKACGVNADCPRGAECKDLEGKKQCWPAANSLKPGEARSCKSFLGCTPDSMRTCHTNSDCAELSGQRCDPSLGRCVAVEQVCPFGTVCDPRGKICVAECAVDADCGDPKLRCSRKICEPIGECKTDLDCPVNTTCAIAPGAEEGQCAPFCRVDVDCPLGKRCLRGGDGRYRCENGCTGNTSCPLNQRCNLTTKQCEGPTVGTARICQGTPSCDTCELCNPSRNECFSARAEYPQHCRPCVPAQGDCPGGSCVQMADSLFYCARQCERQQECPQGFNCLPLTGASGSACVPANRQCQGKCQ